MTDRSRAVLGDGSRDGLRVCGYCGSTLQLDGEVLHREGCTAPVPYGDEDAPDEENGDD